MPPSSFEARGSEGIAGGGGGRGNFRATQTQAQSQPTLDCKLCLFEGCHLADEPRANTFLGAPIHASALASAVCFSLDGGESERLTGDQAQSLVQLYEVAALQELELSEQLERLWGMKPISLDDVSAMDAWRFWLEDYRNPDVYYGLQAIADVVPAADQQHGFVSVVRNSVVLSTGFLKGLHRTLPLVLFIKCMVNFTQAHFLFAAAGLIKDLGLGERGGYGGEGGREGGLHQQEASPLAVEGTKG